MTRRTVFRGPLLRHGDECICSSSMLCHDPPQPTSLHPPSPPSPQVSWLLPSTHLILLTLTRHPSQELGELEELGEFFSDRALKVRLALEPHFSCPTQPPLTGISHLFHFECTCHDNAEYVSAQIPRALEFLPPTPHSTPSLSPSPHPPSLFPSLPFILSYSSLQQTLDPKPWTIHHLRAFATPSPETPVSLLQELTGSDDPTCVTFLEVKINAEDITMRDLGQYPELEAPNRQPLTLKPLAWDPHDWLPPISEGLPKFHTLDYRDRNPSLGT